MSIAALTILLFAAMILGLTLGLPVAFVLGGVAVLFTTFLWGPAGLVLTVTSSYDQMSSWLLIAIPLFIFVGLVLEKAGVAEELYKAMQLWAGGLNGALGMGTILICTIIAAMVGTIGAGIVTAVIIALPQMLKRGYNKHLAYGTIMVGGCLGCLIPPSIHMIVYASIAQQSVGRMLIGGLIPGLILSGLYILYIGVRTALKPSLGPGLLLEERANWRQKLLSLKGLVLPSALIVSVLGSIFLGIATPTEASSIGCLGAITCAAIHRKLTWKLLRETVEETTKMFGMIIWILIGAACFSRFYLAMGAASLIQSTISAMEVSPWLILIGMQVMLIIMGMVMEDLCIIMIAGPIFTPIVVGLGFNPVWFGVIFIINMQIAMMSPPYGFANFYMKGALPEENMWSFYRSTYPFMVLQVIGLALCMAFPKLVLFLPNLMLR